MSLWSCISLSTPSISHSLELTVCKITKTNRTHTYFSKHRVMHFYSNAFGTLFHAINAHPLQEQIHFAWPSWRKKHLIHHFTAVAKQTERKKRERTHQTLRIWKMYLNLLYLFGETTTSPKQSDEVEQQQGKKERSEGIYLRQYNLLFYGWVK